MIAEAWAAAERAERADGVGEVREKLTQAWACVERTFDPSAPAPADVRESAPVQQALNQVHARLDGLDAWYLDACDRVFARFCHVTLAPLHDAGAHNAVPGAIDACYNWVCTRHALLGTDRGALGVPGTSAAFLMQCQTHFTLAMRPAALETLAAYFAHGLSSAHNHIVADAECIQVAAQLRALGLATYVQGVLTTTATQLLEAAVRRETHGATVHALEHAAFPRMHDLLQTQLVPALEALLEARPGGVHLLDEPLRDAWDTSVSHVHDDALHANPEQASLYLRLEYRLSRALGHARLAQLFDIVGTYPRSRAALSDLMVWLEKSDERVAVAEAFLATLHARLLHPGVDTHAILVYYVNIVYALRLVDTSGVILSKVLPPVQRYLRTRPDIIPAVVNALLGDDDAFALLRMELASASASLSRSARLQEDDAAQARPEYWMDPTWTPRPVDAGPEYSQMRTRDVIDLLVSIFDDHNGFIHALEEHTAQQLVRTQDYDTTRVQRNNDIFKRRFGESSLHHCDVMLADIAASQTSDASFHTARDAALRTTSAPAVHALVISRQFWPEIDTRTFTLPRRMSEALEAYAAHYAAAQRKRRVKWLPYLGTVDVEVEMNDGRRVRASVMPVEAAVAELVAGMGVPAEAAEAAAVVDADADADAAARPARPQPRIVTADNVASALAVERPAALAALRFWASHGVLAELAAPAAGSFAIQERVS
ncbi:hypothetical protein GLX27_002452 [Malassezia furfur]|uniref:Cullin family profile domain-containing protein n=1 Tax=Malassezia furfur TaxID=55194 RepID=A0ABY8ESU3_MALFU|nr:hypothetical protein GLX27_002452 [Malassezia furfur]